jgi:hypothetical protein
VRRAAFWSGRLFQLAGLVWMPFSIWAGEIDRDERAAITIFAGAFLVFGFGTLLTRLASKL